MAQLLHKPTKNDIFDSITALSRPAFPPSTNHKRCSFLSLFHILSSYFSVLFCGHLRGNPSMTVDLRERVECQIEHAQRDQVAWKYQFGQRVPGNVELAELLEDGQRFVVETFQLTLIETDGLKTSVFRRQIRDTRDRVVRERQREHIGQKSRRFLKSDGATVL